jgi:hypothetical protein
MDMNTYHLVLKRTNVHCQHMYTATNLKSAYQMVLNMLAEATGVSVFSLISLNNLALS